MQSLTSADPRAAEFARIAETEEDLASLRQQLNDLIEGAAFKGSHRSGQFLKYIVEQAIAGHFESLKERVIGVELFGRSPSYDTGEDAIVRVTASDVRRRLLQHYGRYGSPSDFRIGLPLGSYIPEITRSGPKTLPETVVSRPEATAQPESEIAALDLRDLPILSSVVPMLQIPAKPIPHRIPWLKIGIVLTVFNLIVGAGILWNHFSSNGNAALSVLPWSSFFRSPHFTQIITSDPNIAEVQDLAGRPLSVSDYANRNYLPNAEAWSPETNRLAHIILTADNASSVDTPIAVQIAMLTQAGVGKIAVHAARSIKLADLKTEDNFIFLGSPRSNPWSALFSDQLDFRFIFDPVSHQEIIRNFHPRANEQLLFVPTALGGGTGESFAIIALVQNFDQNGQVLLLAGADAEGTEAAGNFVANIPRLSAALQKCGIPSSSRQQHFQLLLQLNTMAGSPNNIDVAACHLLPGITGR